MVSGTTKLPQAWIPLIPGEKFIAMKEKENKAAHIYQRVSKFQNCEKSIQNYFSSTSTFLRSLNGHPDLLEVELIMSELHFSKAESESSSKLPIIERRNEFARTAGVGELPLGEEGRDRAWCSEHTLCLNG